MPAYGMNGMSPEPPAQPVPDMWVRLNPRMRVVLYAVAAGPDGPGLVRRAVFSGLHCTMPKGVSAPGKVSPPLVPTRVLT